MGKTISSILEEMDEKDKSDINEDRLVCLCKKVSFLTIKKAVEGGANTIAMIRKETAANTGCSSYCTDEILKIIKAFQKS